MIGSAILTDTVDLVDGDVTLMSDVAAHVTTGATRLEVVSGGQLLAMGDMQAMIDGSTPVGVLDAATGVRWHGVTLEWSVGSKPAPVRAHGEVMYWRCALTKNGESWVP